MAYSVLFGAVSTDKPFEEKLSGEDARKRIGGWVTAGYRVETHFYLAERHGNFANVVTAYIHTERDVTGNRNRDEFVRGEFLVGAVWIEKFE